MIWLLTAQSFAGVGQASLIDGTPEFTDCLASDTCASDFFPFSPIP